MGKSERKNWTNEQWIEFFTTEIQKYEDQLKQAEDTEDYKMINQLKGSIKRVQNNQLLKLGQPITKEIKRRNRIRPDKTEEEKEADKVKVQEYWERKTKQKESSGKNNSDYSKNNSKDANNNGFNFAKSPEDY